MLKLFMILGSGDFFFQILVQFGINFERLLDISFAGSIFLRSLRRKHVLYWERNMELSGSQASGVGRCRKDPISRMVSCFKDLQRST